MSHQDNSFDRGSKAPPSRGLRGWLNQNSPTVAVAAVAVLVASMVFIARHQRSQRRPNGHPRVYYYDLVTHEYFVDDAQQLPPIESPAGNPAVRAFFYSCGDCTDEQFLAYYEKYTPEAKRVIQKAKEEKRMVYDLDILDRGLRVSRDAVNWSRSEPWGDKNVRTGMRGKCTQPGEQLTYCPPP